VIRWFRDHYLNGESDIEDWRASPARAETLAGLPPAYVLTAGADPLRDEGEAYANRLRDAGVAVTYRTFPGQFHSFFTWASCSIRPMSRRVISARGCAR
jgi:acetyl esterase